jgi:hypothetical protein
MAAFYPVSSAVVAGISLVTPAEVLSTTPITDRRCRAQKGVYWGHEATGHFTSRGSPTGRLD